MTGTERAPSDEGAKTFLAVVADPETVALVETVVDELLIPNAEVRRGRVEDATKRVTQTAAPEVMLVDVDRSEVPLSDVRALLAVCEPSVQFIVIGQSASLGLFRELIQLGVVDYITKPATKDLLERAIRLARSGNDPWQQRKRAGKIIAVMGTRGGVGASTLAANTGWLLARKHQRRVALVDLDLHTGTLATLFNVQSDHALRNALEAPDQIGRTAIERALTRVSDRLYLLDSEEPIGEVIEYDADAVDRLLDVLAEAFHFVVVDVPRSPDPLHHHVLRHAQIRLVTAEPTVTAARDTIRILEGLHADAFGVRTYLVMNHRVPTGRDAIRRDAFERTVGRLVDLEIPFGRGAVTAALNAGEPLAARGGAVASPYVWMADELSGQGRGHQRGGWTGAVSRMLGRR